MSEGGKHVSMDMVREEIARIEAAVSSWWITLAEEEIALAVPKAVEYGSTDLAELGRIMALILGWEGLTHQEATELGIFFYLQGKLARWTDAIKNRRQVSNDTITDISVYIKMAQRNREVGGWPFNPEDK